MGTAQVEVLAINGKKGFYTQDEFDKYRRPSGKLAGFAASLDDIDAIRGPTPQKLSTTGFVSSEELGRRRYKSKLTEWRTKQLAKYEDGGDWAAKKDEKHGGKEGFAAWLEAEVEKNCSSVKVR